MLGLLLGLLTFDTVTTVNNNIKKKEQARKRDFRIYEIKRKLNRGLVPAHYRDCSCPKCETIRLELHTELKTLITQKTQESK